MKRMAGMLLLTILGLGLAGCAEEPPLLEIRLAGTTPGEGLTAMTIEGLDETFYLHDAVVLGADDIAGAMVVPRETGPMVEVHLTDEGTRAFAEFTRAHIDERAGIVVKGELVSAPVIRAEIAGGKAVIDGRFTETEARELALALIGQE